MKISRILIVLLSSMLMGCNRVSAQSPISEELEEEMDSLAHRIISPYLVAYTDSITASYINLMAEDGSFADLDYEEHVSTVWGAQFHLERCLSMSCSYINPSSVYFEMDSVRGRVVAALDFYNKRNPHHDNWYKYTIKEPTLWGLILLTMKQGKQDIPDSVKNVILERCVERGGKPENFSGANRVEVANLCLYRGIVTDDEELVSASMGYLYETIGYDHLEGLQNDNSFFEHGPQLHIGGYGEVFITNQLNLLNWTKGTRFVPTQEQIKILGRFVRHTLQNVIRGKYIAFNCNGRSVSREHYLEKGYYASLIENLKDVDSQHMDEYESLILRLREIKKCNYKIPARHYYLYRGDYTMHVRPEWQACLRTVSERTIRNEYNGGENIYGYYISDGSTNIFRTGAEYYDIMPLWDWAFIPGTTAPETENFPRTFGYQVFGQTSFSGGVNDSIYGVSAYKYYDAYQNVNTGGAKGYFFFDKEMLCLGTAIKSDWPVHTTIEQNWGGQYVDVVYKDGTCVRLEGETEIINSKNISAILHNGIGYIINSDNQVQMKLNTKTGRWTDNNQSGRESDELKTGKVFLLYLNHGDVTDEVYGKYAYTVIPGVNIEELVDYVKTTDIEILANTDSVQAVMDNKNGILQMVFYKPCTFHASDVELGVSHECVIMLTGISTDSMTLYFADPAQRKESYDISLKAKGMKATRNLVIDMTNMQDIEAGKTMKVPVGNGTVDISNKEIDKDQGCLLELYSLDGIKMLSIRNTRKIPKGIIRPGFYIMNIHSKAKHLTKKIIVK